MRPSVYVLSVSGGKPAVNALAVGQILGAEEAAEGWLLVEHDEEMRDQEEASYEGE